MNPSREQSDPWRLPTLILWSVFFFIALFPELTFYVVRELGGVLPHRAMINSYYFVYLALCAYFVHFVYNGCLRAGRNELDARAIATQMLVVALVAFYPIHLDQARQITQTVPFDARMIMFGVGFLKTLAWAYLYYLVNRYYVTGPEAAFGGMRSLFPSTYQHDAKPDEDAAAEPPPAGETARNQAD